MANRVLLLLKMEVSELIRAAMITAIIRPRRPEERQGRVENCPFQGSARMLEVAAEPHKAKNFRVNMG